MKTNLFSSLLSQTAQPQMSQQVRNNSRLRMAAFALLAVLCLALSAPAFAQTQLYNNGPSLGNANAYFIDTAAVSNSFVTNPFPEARVNNELENVTFAEWVPAGATPLTIDWGIGTTSFGSDLGSGTGNISATLLCSSGSGFNGGACGGGFGYDVYNSTFQLGNIEVTPGETYWLTLSGATDNFGGRDGWDINSGASQAYHDQLGEVPSESFTIDGTHVVQSTPEPSSIMLLGSGILALTGVLRRKML